jgi:hypothetical protein
VVEALEILNASPAFRQSPASTASSGSR